MITLTIRCREDVVLFCITSHESHWPRVNLKRERERERGRERGEC